MDAPDRLLCIFPAVFKESSTNFNSRSTFGHAGATWSEDTFEECDNPRKEQLIVESCSSGEEEGEDSVVVNKKHCIHITHFGLQVTEGLDTS